MPIWIRHSPLNAAVRRRPALLPAIHAMRGSPTLDQGGYSASGVRRAGRAAANGVTHLRSHIDWFTADAPDAGGRSPASIPAASPRSRWRWSRCPVSRSGGMPRPSPVRSPTAESAACWAASSLLPTGTPPCVAGNLLHSAARWKLRIWIISMRSSAKVSQADTVGGSSLPYPFPGHICCCSHGLRAGTPASDAPGSANPASGGARRHPYRPADDQPAAARMRRSAARRARRGDPLQ